MEIPPEPVTRPNIVFILADDLGYTDIAPYGSEVNTPTLSALAAQGVRFSNYHTAANCAPARAMLLTGVGNHLAGVPNIPEMLAPEQRAHAHYQGVLGDNVVTVATLLEDAGYHTYMAGKWHLGSTPNKRPSRRGFQRTVAMMDSGADSWEQRPYLAIYDQANWFADGERFTLPDDFYSSRFLVDKTIEFIDSNIGNGQPFFAYVPFIAVHIPVQAPQSFIDRYMGVYDAGWDVLREQRLQRAVELGLVPADTAMTRVSTTGDWDALDDDRKRYEAKRMAVYGAMIEAMDFHIGRLVEYLKSTGQYDNTIFVFTSDNGSEASGPADPEAFPARLGPAGQGYHTDYERLGLQGSYNSISPGFASASASPLSFYKFYTG
ncbi:MAG TPA: sulfatase-like hydrolase/transferase, partial [Kineobactrum sp.]